MPMDRFEGDSEDEDESLTVPKPSGDDDLVRQQNAAIACMNTNYLLSVLS